MEITIVTLFPQMCETVLSNSIIGNASKKNLLNFHYVNPREYATDSYKTVDDHPYGGGAGMVMRVDILAPAIQAAKDLLPKTPSHVILVDPRGKTFCQKTAVRLASQKKHLIFVCGHYEGIDERVRSLVDEEISLGDFVVTGGELPALCIIDALSRLIPGVLASDSITDESFTQGLLEYPQYTRPQEFNGMTVPNILLSGNHAGIRTWRKKQSLELTKKHRPDLLMEKTDPTEVA